jgi:pimeloyl-ACP methyl ester carboxylesterase
MLGGWLRKLSGPRPPERNRPPPPPTRAPVFSRRGPWERLGIAMLLGAVLLPQAGCSPFRAYEAALVLTDIAAGPGPSRLKDTTPPPTRTDVHYRIAGRTYDAHLYHPGEPPQAAIVLIHGVAEAGPHDPRLVAFAQTLARARFAVLVPELVGLRELQVRADDAQAIADAVAYLHDSAALPALPTGAGAFSYAVGPVLLTALEPPARDRLDFIVAIGGYHSLERVIAFFTTGYYLQDGAWRYRRPNEYGKWLFVLSNAERLEEPEDRALLRAIARRRLDHPHAPVDDLAQELGPQGADVHALIVNRDPERVPELLARLPAPLLEELRALDLANENLRRVQARVILVHGRDDDIIPYTESVALLEAIGRDRAALYLVDGLQHVDVDADFTDAWQLWRAVYRLLGKRTH